eukprot:392175-Prorocentrum_minimum.AAC.2
MFGHVPLVVPPGGPLTGEPVGVRPSSWHALEAAALNENARMADGFRGGRTSASRRACLNCSSLSWSDTAVRCSFAKWAGSSFTSFSLSPRRTYSNQPDTGFSR